VVERGAERRSADDVRFGLDEPAVSAAGAQAERATKPQNVLVRIYGNDTESFIDRSVT
jgi:hypothetical protein